MLNANSYKVSQQGLLTKAFFYLALVVVLSACSLFQATKDARESISLNLSKESGEEISHHLEALGQDYLSHKKSDLINLSKQANRFLIEMHERIVSNNELLFPSYRAPKFYIVKENTPFHFSLPSGEYFFSSGLIRKYLANEDLLAAVMAIEVLRSEKKLFESRSVVPIGNIETERILSLLRLSIEMRSEINKWAFLLMRRSAYDPGALLNLIQLKNKNALDFAASIGNISSISREEFSYKNFLSRTPSEPSLVTIEKNSSRGFYALRRDVLGE